MPQRNYASDTRPFTSKTLPEIFFSAVEEMGDSHAFGRILPSLKVEYISYRETLHRVRQVAGGLEALGIARGDRVAIMSPNRLEWALTDYGCLCSGIVDVPVYPTLTAHQVAYILKDSGSRIVFVPDSEHMAKALEAAAEVGRDIQVVVFDPPAPLPPGVMTWADFLTEGARRAAGWSD